MDKSSIAILGLGYVGLPLAKAFARMHRVWGVDIDVDKINGILADSNESNLGPNRIAFRTNLDGCEANVFIVTVPTPVDAFHIPDLTALRSASSMIGKVLKKGDIVVYESTVYPGCTEEVCIPILEKESSLKINKDFGVGYSPERINPGDKVHRLENIDKIVSGSNIEVLDKITGLYQSIIVDASIYSVGSIKIAEAAKVVENAQRDLNISFMNELAFIFDRMNIDTNEVIDAASTKWNFLPFRPGLVGGHCIGVDPYYLTYKSQQLGYSPDVLLSGRRVNNNMPLFIVNKVVKLLVQKNKTVKGAKVLILGFAFKENCEDFRNTRVADMYQELLEFGADVTVVDPLVDKNSVLTNYQIAIEGLELLGTDYDAVILAVAHEAFKNDMNIARFLNNNKTVFFDTKNFFPKELVSGRL